MIGSPRKRAFDSIREPRRRDRSEDNPWFRDPDDNEKDGKSRRRELSPARPKDLDTSRSRDRDRDRERHGGRNRDVDRERRSGREKSPLRDRHRDGQREAVKLPRPMHLDDAVEDGECVHTHSVISIFSKASLFTFRLTYSFVPIECVNFLLD